MFSVIIQMCVLPMYEELQDRSPAKFQKIVNISFSFLFVFTSIFASLAYMLYGSQTQSNVLLNFPDIPGASLAQAGMVVVILGVYPIMVSPMIAPIAAYEAKKASHLNTPAFNAIRGGQSPFPRRPSRPQRPRRVYSTGATVAIVLAAGGASFFLTDLGEINVINGTDCRFRQV
jgi:amino acid permease